MIDKKFAVQQIGRLAAFPDEYSKLKPPGVDEYVRVLRGCQDEAQAVDVMDSLIYSSTWPTLGALYAAVEAVSGRAQAQREYEARVEQWKREAEPATPEELAELERSLTEAMERNRAKFTRVAQVRAVPGE